MGWKQKQFIGAWYYRGPITPFITGRGPPCMSLFFPKSPKKNYSALRFHYGFRSWTGEDMFLKKNGHRNYMAVLVDSWKQGFRRWRYLSEIRAWSTTLQGTQHLAIDFLATWLFVSKSKKKRTKTWEVKPTRWFKPWSVYPLIGGHLTFKGSLNHPKKVTSRIARHVNFHDWQIISPQ